MSDVHVPKGDFEILIGSDDSCEIRFQGPKFVAALKRKGDRLFIKDFVGAITINGNHVRKKRYIEITRHDIIEVCSSKLNLDPKVFLGKNRVDLDSSELHLVLSDKTKLCDGVYIRAKSGTITAIMGSSGAGKSIFLDLLNGYTSPSKGQILVDKNFDIQSDFDSIRDFIGYVPQDDVMIPELTVAQSLDYRLRLRYPDMKSIIRQQLIQETCISLGLQKNLDIPIGSSESGIRGLSGGQRRRANIAHELVVKPLILILDEPTSGLSSVDADQVVKLLHDLSRQNGMTIIATVHQPSRDAFQYFDDLLLIGSNGRPAYYGKVNKAVSYFEDTLKIQYNNENPPEYILSLLAEEKSCDRAVSQFKKNIALVRQGSKVKDYIYDVDAHFLNQTKTPQSVTKGKKQTKHGIYRNFRQWSFLFQRNFRVLSRDKINVFLLLGQVPIIAALILAAFYNFADDNEAFEVFARRVYIVGETIENQGGKIDTLWKNSYSQVRDVNNKISKFISEFGSRQRAVVYFILVAASIWFGIMGSCKEIVTEQHILKRELRSCVNLFPYLLAKFSMLILLVGFQTAMLTAIVAPILLKLSLLSSLMLWLVLWIASVTSTALGLCISSFSPTYRFALTAVPLILIPQLIFGGMMRPLATINENNEKLPCIIGALTIQRWAFQASLCTDEFSENRVLKQLVDSHKPSPGEIVDEFDIIKYKDSSILDSFFRSRNINLLSNSELCAFFQKGNRLAFFIPVIMLCAFNAVFLYFSYWKLKRKLL